MDKSNYKWILIAYAAVWVSTGTAVTVAIFIVKTMTPLFFLLLPACITISGKS